MKKFNQKTAIIISVILCIIMLAGIILSYIPITAGSKTFLSFSRSINVSTDMMGGMYGEYDITTENATTKTKVDSMTKLRRVLEEMGYKNVNIYSYGDKLRVEVSYPRGSKNYEEVYGELNMVAGGSFKLSDTNPNGSSSSSSSQKEPVELFGSDSVEKVRVYTNNSVKYIQISFNEKGQETYEKICNNSSTIYLSIGSSYTQQISASGVTDFTSLTLQDEKFENLISLEQRVTIGCMGIELNPDTKIINTMSASTATGSSSPDERGFNATSSSIIMFVLLAVIVVSLIALFASRFGLFAVIIGISMLFNSFIFLILMVLMPSIEIGISGIISIVLGLALMYTYTFVFAGLVKSEYNLGKSFSASLESAYKKSLPTIIISNIALFVSSLIIFAFSFGELTSATVIFAIMMALSLLTNLLVIPLLVKVGISFNKIGAKLFMLPKRAIGFEQLDDSKEEE